MIKMFRLYKSCMIRPTIYKTVTKSAVMLALLMLWNRSVNSGRLLLVRDGFFVAGALLLGLTWWYYLRLDGIEDPFDREKTPKKTAQKKRRRTGDIADYADQHIISFDELEEDERLACSMCSSLASALLFLIPALVALAL